MSIIDPSRRRRGLRSRTALASTGFAVLAALLLTACGGSSSSSAPPTTTSSGGQTTTGGQALPVNAQQWLTMDAAAKSVRLTLNAADGDANSGFNFDGLANGQLVVTVPTGWQVTVDCKNKSATVQHSCAIVQSSGSTAPAFPGAETSNPTVGLAPGGSESFTFMAGAAGTYRIDCLVPGHDPAGMWGTFTVVSSGEPSISTTGGGSGSSSAPQGY